MKTAKFTIKQAQVRAGGRTYTTWRLRGWLNGERVRKQFASRAEAMGEKLRFEVKAANVDGEIRPVNTRLSQSQLIEAEAAFHRLSGQSLTLAVQWFLDTYRPPTAAKSIEDASAVFLADRLPQVSHFVQRSYKRLCKTLGRVFAKRDVHTITTAELLALREQRPVGPKAWNNARADLHAFFEFCRAEPRAWLRENPAKPLPVRKVSRGIPQIETAARIAELFAFLETWTGGGRVKRKPGFLVPYFALCTFAGMRPAIPAGEVWELGQLDAVELKPMLDLELGVIRVGPGIAKTNDLRQITIQPNLRAWLERYPLKEYPIVMPNMEREVRRIRRRFGLGDNVLRHTFISMHVAKFRSLGDTALQAGNSETMIKRHYLNMITFAESEAFWAITPSLQITAS